MRSFSNLGFIQSNELFSNIYRNFSIMDYYRSVRPVPSGSYSNKFLGDFVADPKNEIRKSVRPYYGPNITSRQPIPSTVTTITWENPVQPPNPKVVRVALLGHPNSGKSSLMNALLKSTIAATSPKVNTTRESIKGILTTGDVQIIFIDSPGIIASHKRKVFCRQLVETAWNCYEEADICLFVVDVVKRPTGDLCEVLRYLTCSPLSKSVHDHHCHDSIYTDMNKGDISMTQSIPVALVLNKVDLVSHKKWIKSRMRELNVHGKFSAVFFTSAKKDIGLHPILSYLKNCSKPRSWPYPGDMITTQNKVQIVEQLIRTYIFCWFNKDLPYRIQHKIIGWTYSDNGSLNIESELYVRTCKMAKIVCGTRGRIVKQLQKNVSHKLSKLWDETVFLFVHIKIKDNT